MSRLLPFPTPARRILSLLAFTFLAACSSLSVVSNAPTVRAQVQAFDLDARFAVTQDHQRHAGRLVWAHATAGRDDLLLSSPFGQGVARIVLEPGSARIEMADGRVQVASDAEALTRDLLGYGLPVASLADWALGRVEGAGLQRDTHGRPMQLDTAGWHVAYGYDDDTPEALPARLDIRRDGGPEILLRIEAWRLP